MIAFISCCLCIILLFVLINFLYKVWFTPTYIQYVMRSQGIRGPSYKFLYGNTKEMSAMKKKSFTTPMELSHNIYPQVLPHIYSWVKLYGKNFLCWHGPQAFLVVTEPEMIKEALSNKDGEYHNVVKQGNCKKLISGGLSKARGEKWSRLRKIADHNFHAESLKNMLPAMIAGTEEMLKRWRHLEAGEIEAYGEFKILTSEIISRTAFGSSYLEGKRLFDMITEMLLIIVRDSLKVGFPGIGKLFKSADDIKSDKIVYAMRQSLLMMIENREQKVMKGEAESFGSDFLGALIKASHDEDERKQISVEEMIEECKTFYIAGQETTNSLLAWIAVLLATHQDWQEKARNEVLEVFGQQNPKWEGISRLQIMSMIINETLRLYSPAAVLTRRVETKTILGDITVPENTELLIPILALHHDPDIWGEDAHLFKPERFAEGVAKATKDNPMAFFPFGFGQRTCVGMNFARTEEKIAISMILQQYKFTLSPTYVHSPAHMIFVRPQHGVQIILQKL